MNKPLAGGTMSRTPLDEAIIIFAAELSGAGNSLIAASKSTIDDSVALNADYMAAAKIGAAGQKSKSFVMAIDAAFAFRAGIDSSAKTFGSAAQTIDHAFQTLLKTLDEIAGQKTHAGQNVPKDLEDVRAALALGIEARRQPPNSAGDPRRAIQEVA